MAPSDLLARAESFSDELVSFRHDLHQHPELSFQEERTAQKIEEALGALSLSPRRIGGTGVMADIPGSDGMKPCVALRADIDALPINEQTGLPYASQNPGVMHACGHDIHSSCLLGAARLLAQTDAVPRTGGIRLIFQPAEERLPGGAATLIRAGALEKPRPTAIIGQHIDPTLPVGHFGFRGGPFMASVDDLAITIRGRGGHAAHPDRLADPVIASAALIVALQHVAGRSAPPSVPSVLSVGRVIAEGATNIVPDSVYLEGTFRTLSEAWRRAAQDKILRVCREIAASYDCVAEVEISKGYPSLNNDPNLTAQARSLVRELSWVASVTEPEVTLGGEDFAYYAAEIPGCFYHLGVWEESLGPAPESLHSPRLVASDRALPLGAATMAAIALSVLESAGKPQPDRDKSSAHS